MAPRKKRSKKPSAASSGLPEEVVLFLDESIGSLKVAAALRALGARVEVHGDYFPQGTPDEEWLSAIGAKGWAVLTRDQRIRFRKLEQQALADAGVRAFVFTGGNATGDETAAAVAKAFVKIANIIGSERPPFIYAIARSGAVSRLK
jgi:hypothetical protein